MKLDMMNNSQEFTDSLVSSDPKAALSQAPYEVLVIDDEPAIGEIVCEIAKGVGLDAVYAENESDFHRLYHPNVKAIVLDLSMPQMDGVEVMRWLADHDCQSRIILASGSSRQMITAAQKLAKARNLNVVGALSKPIQIEVFEKLLVEDSDIPSLQNSSDSGGCNPGDIRRALELGQILPFYQPKVHAGDGRIVGFEALARWNHPEMGILGPGVFLAQLMESGYTHRLTMSMAHSVAAEVSARNIHPDIKFSINVDAVDLSDLDFCDQLSSIVEGHGQGPERFILEITEHGVVEHLVPAMDNMVRLRLKGFGVAIDDFGTGHSTLSQLSEMPFTELKLDKSFIDSINETVDSRAVVRSMISLGHELGMEVVAEGVETVDQLESLKTLDCDLIQGFLVGRPQDIEDTHDWIGRYQKPNGWE